MLPDSTTTIGEEELERTERLFQSMKAVLRTRAKLRTWIAVCRGWWRRDGGREESIVMNRGWASYWWVMKRGGAGLRLMDCRSEETRRLETRAIRTKFQSVVSLSTYAIELNTWFAGALAECVSKSVVFERLNKSPTWSDSQVMWRGHLASDSTPRSSQQR